MLLKLDFNLSILF